MVCVLGAYLGEVLGARLAAGKAGTILPFLLVFLVWVSIYICCPYCIQMMFFIIHFGIQSCIFLFDFTCCHLTLA